MVGPYHTSWVRSNLAVLEFEENLAIFGDIWRFSERTLPTDDDREEPRGRNWMERGPIRPHDFTQFEYEPE